MTGVLDVVVLAWLLAVMSMAAVEALREFRATPHIARADRRRAAAIGALAVFYCVGYAAVLAGLVPVLAWSQFFRGVSILSIPVVWIMPARARRLRWERDREAAHTLVRAAAERAESAPPAEAPTPVRRNEHGG